MAHKSFVVPGFANPVILLHNDDWSGMATIEWWDHTYHRVEVPAGIILALSFSETKRFIVDGIEVYLDTLVKDPSKGKRT